jgi:zinc transport system substrate-binding protein
MNIRPTTLALAAMLMLALLAFAACDTGDEPDLPSAPAVSGEPDSPAEPAMRAEPLSVVASIYPLGYFAERVGGDLVTVEVLVSPGFENHGFVPTASDLRLLEAADLVVMNGLELDPWIERALATLGENPDRVVVEAADESRAIEGFAHDDHGHEEEDAEAHEEEDDHAHEDDDDHGHEEEDAEAHEEDDDHAHEDDDDHGHDEEEDDHAREDDGHDHEHGELDPHMWLDPTLAVVQVQRIRDALIEIDPANAETYGANASTLSGELESLDSEIAEGLGVCQHDHFVTSHAAYGYLAERFGLEQIPVSGLSPDVDPSPRQLAAISDQIADLGLKHVMVEPVLSGELTRTLASEHDIDLIPIHAIESVTTAELEAHVDYFGLMRDNLASLVLALDCA